MQAFNHLACKLLYDEVVVDNPGLLFGSVDYTSFELPRSANENGYSQSSSPSSSSPSPLYSSLQPSDYTPLSRLSKLDNLAKVRKLHFVHSSPPGEPTILTSSLLDKDAWDAIGLIPVERRRQECHSIIKALNLFPPEISAYIFPNLEIITMGTRGDYTWTELESTMQSDLAEPLLHAKQSVFDFIIHVSPTHVCMHIGGPFNIGPAGNHHRRQSNRGVMTVVSHSPSLHYGTAIIRNCRNRICLTPAGSTSQHERWLPMFTRRLGAITRSFQRKIDIGSSDHEHSTTIEIYGSTSPPRWGHFDHGEMPLEVREAVRYKEMILEGREAELLLIYGEVLKEEAGEVWEGRIRLGRWTETPVCEGCGYDEVGECLR